MTKLELIELLIDPAKQIKDHAVVSVWDIEAGCLTPLTGIVYRTDSVELCTDDMND